MGDAAGAAAETANGAGNAAAGGETPTPLTRDDVKAIFDEGLKGITSKYNAELAGLRKRLDGNGANGNGGGQAPEPKPSEPKHEPAKAENFEAIAAAMEEIGEIRADLSPTLREKLKASTDGMTYAEKLRTYRVARDIHGEMKADPKPAKEAGDETSVKNRGETPKTSRPTVPAARESAPRPKNWDEYIALTKTEAGRKLKAQLDADDSFDLESLPRR